MKEDKPKKLKKKKTPKQQEEVVTVIVQEVLVPQVVPIEQKPLEVSQNEWTIVDSSKSSRKVKAE